MGISYFYIPKHFKQFFLNVYTVYFPRISTSNILENCHRICFWKTILILLNCI